MRGLISRTLRLNFDRISKIDEKNGDFVKNKRTVNPNMSWDAKFKKYELFF
jgi:hypothetical protein